MPILPINVSSNQKIRTKTFFQSLPSVLISNDLVFVFLPACIPSTAEFHLQQSGLMPAFLDLQLLDVEANVNGRIISLYRDLLSITSFTDVSYNVQLTSLLKPPPQMLWLTQGKTIPRSCGALFLSFSDSCHQCKPTFKSCIGFWLVQA